MKPNCEIEADLELTVCVEAEIGGRYIPASIEGPAEYPGIEALRITLEGIDITEAIGYKTKKYLEEVVMEEFDAERGRMSEGKGMYGPIRIWGHCAECRDRKDALKVEVVNVEEEEIYETP